MKKRDKVLFVTVGTTKFERLINRILENDILTLLEKLNITNIILQVGNGLHSDETLKAMSQSRDASLKFKKQSIEFEVYRYKSTLKDDLTKADLVISHAGAGSILESLENDKLLIVVCNEDLMDNHQFELAEKMCQQGYLLYTTCSNLDQKLQILIDTNPKFNKYLPGNPNLFGNYLKKITL